MISLEDYNNNPKLVSNQLFDKLKERVFLKTEIDVVYTDLVNWERYNLLHIGGDSEKGDWKRINYLEYIWIKIIESLRMFGFSYQEIEMYKSELFRYPSFSEIIEAAKIDIDNVEAKLGNDVVSELFTMSESDYDKNPGFGMTIFDTIIVNSICTREKWSLLFFKDLPGLYFPLSSETLRGFEKINSSEIPLELLSKTFVSISLTEIISNFLVDGENSFQKNRISILTKNEHNVLKQIRKGYGKIKSIKIRFKANDMELLEVTSIKKVELESRLLEHIKKGEYQSIVIDTVDGKIVNFENTQKLKLRNTE